MTTRRISPVLPDVEPTAAGGLAPHTVDRVVSSVRVEPIANTSWRSCWRPRY
ncbi:hypothetical protein ACH47B_31275 [Rhodococcus sp. NPDC019627]|uniref:hypothetical protein n=1 Tax=unclassified Rhodococcus (in: high G+C Gram-positive bacteria) TaxID=192944 RepID=UPI0033D1457E